MKKLTSAIALGLVLVSGSAVAANIYGVQNDQELSIDGDLNFQSTTQYLGNEVVELDRSLFSDVDAAYNVGLYRGSK